MSEMMLLLSHQNHSGTLERVLKSNVCLIHFNNFCLIFDYTRKKSETKKSSSLVIRKYTLSKYIYCRQKANTG